VLGILFFSSILIIILTLVIFGALVWVLNMHVGMAMIVAANTCFIILYRSLLINQPLSEIQAKILADKKVSYVFKVGLVISNILRFLIGVIDVTYYFISAMFMSFAISFAMRLIMFKVVGNERARCFSIIYLFGATSMVIFLCMLQAMKLILGISPFSTFVFVILFSIVQNALVLVEDSEQDAYLSELVRSVSLFTSNQDRLAEIELELNTAKKKIKDAESMPHISRMTFGTILITVLVVGFDLVWSFFGF